MNYANQLLVHSPHSILLLTSFFLITFFLSGFTGFPQTTVNIPDANFRAKLVAMSGISAGTGNNVMVDNISAITRLDVSNTPSVADAHKITNLTGIEAFTALTLLYCYGNQLTELNISANTDLTFLNCYKNQCN